MKSVVLFRQKKKPNYVLNSVLWKMKTVVQHVLKMQ